MRLARLLILCLLSAGCTTATSLMPSPTGASATALVGATVQDVARDGTFELNLSTPRDSVPAGLPITPITTITYLGPADAIQLGSADPAVVFNLEQIDGRHRVGGGASDVCMSTVLKRGEPDQVPFGKVGGFSADDPDAAWLQAYFRDPLLELPAGTWRITAILEAYVPSCGGIKHQLRASIVVAVTN